MLRNYFVTAVNNLLKNKLYSLINVTGLAIGLAACILISLYVLNELSYDRHWQDAEKIYRLNTELRLPGRDAEKVAQVSGPTLGYFQNYFSSEIETGSRVLQLNAEIEIDGNRFEESTMWVDAEFTTLFQLDVIAGSLESTLQNNSGIALSTELATRFFGETDPLGQRISIARSTLVRDFQVTAVYEQPEQNTALSLPALALLDENEIAGIMPYFLNPGAPRTATFVKLNSSTDSELLASQVPEFMSQLALQLGVEDSGEVAFNLQALTNVHLNPFGVGEFKTPGNKTTVLVFTAISVLVILIGCINFITLTTARATSRAKEVAMRTALGARRYQLVVQFLGESFLVVLAAIFLAIVTVELLSPFIEGLVGVTLDIPYSNPMTYIALSALLLFIGIICGLYPAVILSSFRPALALKANSSQTTQGSSVVRSLLVIFQFTVSIALIISTIVIVWQASYAIRGNHGFNQENLLMIEGLSRDRVADKKALLKQELLNLEEVSNVTLASEQAMQFRNTFSRITLLPDSQLSNLDGIDFEVESWIANSSAIGVLNIDKDFFDTYEMPLVAGRYYDERYVTDGMPVPDANNSGQILKGSIVINQSAVRQLGLASAADAVGRMARMIAGGDDDNIVFADLTIIGIVSDSQFHGLHRPAQAEVFILAPDRTTTLTLRFGDDPLLAMEQVEAAWRSVMGNELLITNFVSQAMLNELRQERSEARMLSSFAMLAIVIACLGLYGLASFTVEKRIKEIGLRKALGARVKDIVRLLLWQFSKPILIANLIAWPITIGLMLSWLQRFPFQIDSWLLLPLCLFAGIVTLIIAAATVAEHSRRVARRSPIQALRYE